LSVGAPPKTQHRRGMVVPFDRRRDGYPRLHDRKSQGRSEGGGLRRANAMLGQGARARRPTNSGSRARKTMPRARFADVPSVLGLDDGVFDSRSRQPATEPSGISARPRHSCELRPRFQRSGAPQRATRQDAAEECRRSRSTNTPSGAALRAGCVQVTSGRRMLGLAQRLTLCGLRQINQRGSTSPTT